MGILNIYRHRFVGWFNSLRAIWLVTGIVCIAVPVFLPGYAALLDRIIPGSLGAFLFPGLTWALSVSTVFVMAYSVRGINRINRIHDEQMFAGTMREFRDSLIVLCAANSVAMIGALFKLLCDWPAWRPYVNGALAACVVLSVLVLVDSLQAAYYLRQGKKDGLW